MKKLFVMLMAVVIAITMLTGCGVGSYCRTSSFGYDEDGNKVTISHVVERDSNGNVTDEYTIYRDGWSMPD